MCAAPVKTASEDDSIWKGLDEDTFRRTIVALAKASNNVPGDTRDYSSFGWENRHLVGHSTNYSLLISDEQHIADDLAYVACFREGVKAVSAVALEEHVNCPGLTVRLAANASIPQQVSEQLNAILQLLRSRAEKGLQHLILTSMPKSTDRHAVISERLCISSVFHAVVDLDRERIHGRLRSEHWHTPSYYRHDSNLRKSLYQDLLALLPDIRKIHAIRPFAVRLESLCNDYKEVDVDFVDPAEGIRLLQKAIRSSSDFRAAIESRLAETSEVSFANAWRSNKHLQQVAKIGNYWDLCVFLAKTADRYRDLFKRLNLELLRPYIPGVSSISIKNRFVECYVHAEIQLATFYAMTPDFDNRTPRVLGVSKSACYLCDLFLSLHGRFFVSRSHGRLYDQWTVPDLAEYRPEQRREYRRIIQEMYKACCTSLANTGRSMRNWPLESTCNLHELLSSIATSTVTVDSSQSTIKGASPSRQTVSEMLNSEAPASEPVREKGAHPDHDTPAKEPSSPQTPDKSHIPSNLDKTEPEGLRRSLENLTIENLNRLNISTFSSSTKSNDKTPKPLLKRTLTQRTPYSVVIQGICICFETEEPTRGKIRVKTQSNHSEIPADAINVDTMAPGEVVDFYRDNEIPNLSLNLVRKGHEPINIELQWLLPLSATAKANLSLSLSLSSDDAHVFTSLQSLSMEHKLGTC